MTTPTSKLATAPVKPATRTLDALLQRCQIASAIIFLPFLLTHLLNTILASFGATLYDNFQSAAQNWYQQPAIELGFVLIPLTVHMLAGLSLAIRRRRRGVSRKLSMHSAAGFFLLVVVAGHVISTRGLPYFNGFHAGFGGVAFSLWWLPAVFFPYYFLLFMAGFYHAVNGLCLLVNRITTSRLSLASFEGRALCTIALCFVITALLSFSGQLANIDDPRNNKFARLYSSLYNIDLSRSWHQAQ
ncbi:MAG: hypothetical protein AB8B86_08125 [Pseudomonadales bacterium]